jgi:hypothetical protein
MPVKKPAESFSKKEAQHRFEAALRGARVAGHMPMKKAVPKPARKKPSKQ